MSESSRRRLGVMYDRDRAPEGLPAFARALDELPVDDLWVVEDLSWAGGVTSAAIALGASERLRVGLGIAPAPLRNPVLLAMELATLARVHPGRLIAGIGHGVPGWMDQVGAGTPHKLALLGETITAVQTLLRGETLTLRGEVIHVDGVTLVHPPSVVPPVVAGVVGPRSLALAGRVADGTILPEGIGPAGVTAALARIDATAPHELTVFTYLSLDTDAPAFTEMVTDQARWLGVAPDAMHSAAGDPATAADRVRQLWDAGAGTVAVRPFTADPIAEVRALLAALGR
ncbi:oxidoreductase [Actinocatenispora thailandica]|uniref:Oxidoreductase n=1 Tax=Actinocatenispora thailandica TaxID=227318 RepID=A0A7R7DPP0_9ACTN|nr:LLM class flavin-dependent oxidoreductase [Actinocatenispora thailandica]BCJ35620.1 oxidoreductase [Actinocatenispora thailandica]